MTLELLEEFSHYLNLGFYFKAHELLEENLWVKGSKDKTNLYVKGLINDAVSMELYKRGRPEAGARVWKTYNKYKIDSYYEINHRVEKAYEKISNSSRI